MDHKRKLEIAIEGDESAALERFHAWGFTDGLPIVIPTRERVDRMCAGAKHYALESLGNLAPRNGAALARVDRRADVAPHGDRGVAHGGMAPRVAEPIRHLY